MTVALLIVGVLAVVAVMIRVGILENENKERKSAAKGMVELYLAEKDYPKLVHDAAAEVVVSGNLRGPAGMQWLGVLAFIHWDRVWRRESEAFLQAAHEAVVKEFKKDGLSITKQQSGEWVMSLVPYNFWLGSEDALISEMKSAATKAAFLEATHQPGVGSVRVETPDGRVFMGVSSVVESAINS